MHNHVVNGLGHFEIAGPDAGALAKFYAGVFDWGVQEQGPGFSLVNTPDGSANGSIAEGEAASLTIGIVVADLDEALARATREGGVVAMPVVDNGWVKKAAIEDPAGNRITIIQA